MSVQLFSYRDNVRIAADGSGPDLYYVLANVLTASAAADNMAISVYQTLSQYSTSAMTILTIQVSVTVGFVVRLLHSDM